MATKPKAAVAFYRKRGEGRQARPLEAHRKVVDVFATAVGYEIVAEFADKSPAGDCGRGFSSLLTFLEAKGVSTVLVASRAEFATDSLVRTIGFAALLKHGVRLVAADDPEAFANSEPTPELIARVLALNDRFEAFLERAYSEGERERRQIKSGPKHRQRYADMRPEAVELAKSLHLVSLRENARMSFRQISAKLADAGQHNNAGKPYHPEEIRRMIKGPRPRRGTF